MKINRFTEGVFLEDSAIDQINNVANMPFVETIAVMPDAHWGCGATVGSVISQYKAIIPAAVGVDIGCGMTAIKTSLKSNDLPDCLHKLRCEIEKNVPYGRTNNGQSGDAGAWGDIPEDCIQSWLSMKDSFDAITDKHEKIKKCNNVVHLGTLGTGNHFIEICLDLNNNVWVMLHSGSRGVGNRIGSYFIEKAKLDMKRWHINLPDINLAYIPEGSFYFQDYIEAVKWAQSYAKENRRIMMNRVLNSIIKITGKKNIYCTEEAIDCHHNYVSLESHFGKNVYVTRKGAVRARKGDLGIIPGSMGDKSFIVKGKGNKLSLNSCSHGAGRIMSRTEARKRFTADDVASQTHGVECRKDHSVVDEIPSAYKNIDDVMKAQDSLVEIVTELKQILCVKG